MTIRMQKRRRRGEERMKKREIDREQERTGEIGRLREIESKRE